MFAAALALRAAGKPIDNVTLASQLEEGGMLGQVGGRAQLASMRGSVPTAANASHYAAIIVDKARRRAALAIIEQSRAALLNGHDQEAGDVLGSVTRSIASVRGAFGQAGKVELTAVGTGWEGVFAGGVTIRCVHLKERSDEYTGEFTITLGTDRLEWGRFNLLSARTRAEIAKRLEVHVRGGRWAEVLDGFCHEVVRRERKGVPLEFTNPEAPRRSLAYALRPFLPYGMPTLLYGEGGTGKSTVAAAVALSLQTGKSVFPGWEPMTMPVLILDWEATREVWEDRLNAVADGAGVKRQRIAYRPCRRRLADDAEAIADAVLDNGVGCVIVDAVNQAFGFAHQEQDPAEAAVKAFSTIREIAGADVTWLLIDHVTGETMHGQSNGQTPLKSYGTVSKQWLARQMFFLAGEREASETRQELVLKHTKANYSWKMPPLPMVIHREKGAGTLRFEFGGKVTDEALAAQLTLPQRITDALRDGALMPEKLREVLGMNGRKGDRDKVNVNLGRMVGRGVLIKLTSGAYELDPGNEQEDLEVPPPVDEDEIK